MYIFGLICGSAIQRGISENQDLGLRSATKSSNSDVLFAEHASPCG